MRVKIIPYKIASQSGKALAGALRERGHTVHRVKRDSETYRPRRNHLLVNWGCSDFEMQHHTGNVLNKPNNVAAASNKLIAFQMMQEAGVSIPDFTDNWGVADDWMQEDGHTIVARHTLRGHSGVGIEIVSHAEGVMDLPEAPLYVKYIKKQSEFRVHVFNKNVIDIQQKRKRQEMDNDDVNYQVRNHANGWVFCRDGIEEPQGIRELAVAAVNALGLDFGAVDIIHNQHHNQLYVLEVNTAMGLEGTTTESYANAINEYTNQRNVLGIQHNV